MQGGKDEIPIIFIRLCGVENFVYICIFKS